MGPRAQVSFMHLTATAGLWFADSALADDALQRSHLSLPWPAGLSKFVCALL
jgi:hypothetical protein